MSKKTRIGILVGGVRRHDDRGYDREDIRGLGKMRRKNMLKFCHDDLRQTSSTKSGEAHMTTETIETIEKKLRRDWKIKSVYYMYGY